MQISVCLQFSAALWLHLSCALGVDPSPCISHPVCVPIQRALLKKLGLDGLALLPESRKKPVERHYFGHDMQLATLSFHELASDLCCR